METNKNTNNAVDEFIGMCMMSVTYIHSAHFATNSYAQHKALGDFYTEMEDLIDTFVEFSFYSRHLEDVICVEAEIDYKPPEPNNDVSDHDNYGGFIINTIELYSQGSKPQRIYATSEKQRELLDLEVRAQLNKHVRNLDVETCMYDMDVPFLFGEDE